MANKVFLWLLIVLCTAAVVNGTFVYATLATDCSALNCGEGSPSWDGNWDAEVVSLTLSSFTLDAGEELKVNALIKNTGEKTGTFNVLLKIQNPNGEVVEPDRAKIYDLSVGKSESVSLSYTVPNIQGDYCLSVEILDDPGLSYLFDCECTSFSVIPVSTSLSASTTTPALSITGEQSADCSHLRCGEGSPSLYGWDAEILSITPASATLAGGETLDITVLTENTGGKTGTFNILLYVQEPNGDVVQPDETKVSDLPVRETKSASLSYTVPETPGRYCLSIEVVDDPEESWLFDCECMSFSVASLRKPLYDNLTTTATADSFMYTLSGGPSPETSLVVDDDLEVTVNGKTVLLDSDGVSTKDGRATWNGSPIAFFAAPGDVLQIRATNPGGTEIELSPLYLHVSGHSVKLSEGIPKTASNVPVFFDETFTISIPAPEIAITAPKEGEELSWSPEGYAAKGTYSGLRPGLNFYVIVHPLTTNQWWVQNAPTLSDEGTWEAIVNFGTKDLGAGEEYELHAVLTESTLEMGLVDSFPDSVATSVVRVSRVEASPFVERAYLYGGIIGLAAVLLVVFAYRKGRKSRGLVKKAQESEGARKKPKLDITITADTGFKVNTWEQLHATISNSGAGRAQNIMLTLSGPVEMGGVNAIPTLDPAAQAEVTLGIKPKEHGKLPLVIRVSYFDETDRPSELSFDRYINVAKEDEKVSERPVNIHIGSIGEILGTGATKTGDIGILKGGIGVAEKRTKKCSRCGQAVSEDEKFCPECGEPLR